MITFMCSHKLRRDELRVGHANMPINKKKDEEKYVSIKQYGLDGPHHILLEGISFPPEKRSSMTQSLGPMTTAIMLSKHGSSVQFGQKWKDALARDCAHIPEIQSIVNMISGKQPSDIKGLLRALADLLLITTSRNAHRAFFSICMVTNYLITDNERKFYHF